MPTIPVNDSGAALYYEDSGVPTEATEYNTVIAIHGILFHGATFRPAFKHATSHNLRIVSVNQRDYPGSTSLSDQEIADLCSQDTEIQAGALRNQAIEIATFITRFIEQENIPPPKSVDGKNVGGVSIFGWSQGAVLALALLSSIQHLSSSTEALLAKYLRTVFVHDPPFMCLGIPPIADAPSPFNDPTVTPDRLAQVFTDWVASFYNPLSSPESITAESLMTRSDLYKTTGEEKYLATTLRLPKADVEALTSPEVFPRSVFYLSPLFSSAVSGANLRGALLHTQGRWSGVRVVFTSPDMTIWACSLAGKGVSDMLKTPAKEGEVRRDVEMVWLEGANHLYHYEQPEKFVGLLARYV